MDRIDEKIIVMTEQQFREFTIAQFQEGRDEFLKLHEALAANTELTKANIASTAELVTIFSGAKTGAAAFSWLGRNVRKLVTFIYPFVLLGGAIWAIFHGKPPKWGE